MAGNLGLNEARREALRLAEKWGMDGYVKVEHGFGGPFYRASVWGHPADSDVIEVYAPTEYHTCKTCRPDLYPNR